MADMTTIKGRIAETIYPNGKGAITAESHQALLLEMVDDINAKKADLLELIATQESLNALKQKVDNLPQGDEFDKQGNYPLLHVGTADDLAGRGESVPASFGFRASGGKSIKDGRAYIKRIKGNSLVWNQGFPDTYPTQVFKNRVDVVASERLYTCTVNSIAYTFVGFYFNREQISIIPTHKYLVSYVYKGGKNAILQGGIDLQKGEVSANANIATQFAYIDTANNGTLSFVMNTIIESMEVGDTFTVSDIKVIDLTQMFQAGNEPTTIEEFNARVATLGVDMNAYNEGQVIHCNTESIKSVGDNAWDEQWEEGILSNGNNYFLEDRIRSKNYIKVIGGEEYYYNNQRGNINDYIVVAYYDENKNYLGQINAIPNNKFTLPLSAHYIRFYTNLSYGGTYTNDIMISLVHSGWKQDTDAGYQPYWQDTLPLPIIRKYFPQGMKKAGTAHDEIRYNKASGKWEYSKGKIKSVDLGTFDYTTGSTNLADSKRMRARTKISDAVLPANDAQVANILCGSYIAVSSNNNWQNKEGVCIGADGYLYVYDKEKQDAASFKADMAGVMLYYEAAEWEWVELDAEDQNFRDYYNVADFGTEMSQSSVPSANFSADIIYQFNAVDMIREHELEITELQSIIATMQAQLTSLINGGQ